MAGCLKALHDALLPTHDLNWLARQERCAAGTAAAELGATKLEVTVEGGIPSSWAEDGKDRLPPRKMDCRIGQLRFAKRFWRKRQAGAAAIFARRRRRRVATHSEPVPVSLKDDRVVRAQVTFFSDERPGDADWLAELGPEHADWLHTLAMMVLQKRDTLLAGRETPSG